MPRKAAIVSDQRPEDFDGRSRAHSGQDAAAPSSSAAPSFFAGKRIYLIGIGGCGMSGLARLVRAAGARIEGSESVPCDFSESLARDGVLVHTTQVASNISPACDLVIATAAVKEGHVELSRARELGIPIMPYAEALGRLQGEHTGISIAGTHGKSTTTALLAHIMIACGLDPSFLVGANCAGIGGNARAGAKIVPCGPCAGRAGFLLAEACEFNRSFHHHRPVIGLINNVEADHLDIYGSLDNVVEAFAGFAQRIGAGDSDGTLLIAHDNPHRERITRDLTCQIITFGESDRADYPFRHDQSDNSCALFDRGVPCATWRTPMPGPHSAHNAAAAAIIAHLCGGPWETIGRAIESFPGVDRRMQRLGTRTIRGAPITVYDDYGHHPTEIRSTLEAIRAHEKPDRLICIFQPHQHSRTRFLLDDFARSFNAADLVIVPHIYFVRDGEEEKHCISARDLVDRILASGVQAMHAYPFSAVVDILEADCRGGDLIVNMGAGPVWQIAHEFLNRGEPQMHTDEHR